MPWLVNSHEVLSQSNRNLSLWEQSRSSSDSGSYIVYQRDSNESQNSTNIDTNLNSVSINNLLADKYWKCSIKWNSETKNRAIKHVASKPKSDEVKSKPEKPSSKNSKNSKDTKEKVKQTRRVYKTEESNVVLKGFKFKYHFIPNAMYNKKLIVCQYPGCNKSFSKTWNFRDHAMKHEGIKPYSWHIWGRSFTQKGNQKKHLKVHRKSKKE